MKQFDKRPSQSEFLKEGIEGSVLPFAVVL